MRRSGGTRRMVVGFFAQAWIGQRFNREHRVQIHGIGNTIEQSRPAETG